MASLQSRYEQLSGDRSMVLDRAEECAAITIPFMYPPEGTATQTQKFKTPWQSLGARAVNNLAAKLLLSLFPPNSPFFRLAIDDITKEKLGAARGDVEQALSKLERVVMNEIETNAARPSLNEALKQLVVGGNTLLYIDPRNKFRVFSLRNYVVKRDPMGNVMEIVVKECLSYLELSPSVRDLVDAARKESTKENHEDNIDLFTSVKYDGKVYQARQEILGKEIVEARGSYAKDKLPWLPLRWVKIDGEDYGRGMVEQYLGDLNSLEGLQQAIVEGSAVAARVLFLVRPNSTTNPRDVANAPNGAVRSGHKDDVSVLGLEKYGDFRVALETRNEIITALSYAFMLNSAIQRSGERVTAEEIRYMAGELETALGGVYSTLSQELQLPLVSVLMDSLERAGRLPKLPKGVAKPAITTGVEALGRGNDMTRLGAFMQSVPPELRPVAAEYLNMGELLKRNAASSQIDPQGLIKTEEEVQAARQQAQLVAAAQSAAPQIAKGMMDQGGTPQ